MLPTMRLYAANFIAAWARRMEEKAQFTSDMASPFNTPDLSPSGAANPLREGLRMRETPQPCTMVIFGATGDLSHRKLIPALFALSTERYLPPSFTVLGYSRRSKPDLDFREDMAKAIQKHSRLPDAPAETLRGFTKDLFYIPGDFDDPEGFRRLGQRIAEIESERGIPANRLFYLATPPNAFEKVIRSLGHAGLNQNERGWTRIVIEKPFGRDLASAQQLNRTALSIFREDQIYRIDHYLGKENVQNILVFRFANGIFEPIWNRRYIDNVQMTVAETLGVEDRAGYFETAGTLRDIVQNHMMQLLCLTAMEPPAAMSGDAVRDEKVKVLRSLRPVDTNSMESSVIRGQYGPGSIGGKQVPAYRQEQGVAPESTVETFVALEMLIDNWRWSGVPFYLRAGKRLPRRITEIAIEFKRAPLHFFNVPGVDGMANLLTMTVQPDEGIALRFLSKVPGQQAQIRPVLMNFRYGTSFALQPPEAYEHLLLDCMLGDTTLFTRADEVERSWEYFTPILDRWGKVQPADFPNYEAGTWGPPSAESLLAGNDRRWRRL